MGALVVQAPSDELLARLFELAAGPVTRQRLDPLFTRFGWTPRGPDQVSVDDEVHLGRGLTVVRYGDDLDLVLSFCWFEAEGTGLRQEWGPDAEVRAATRRDFDDVYRATVGAATRVAGDPTLVGTEPAAHRWGPWGWAAWRTDNAVLSVSQGEDLVSYSAYEDVAVAIRPRSAGDWPPAQGTFGLRWREDAPGDLAGAVPVRRPGWLGRIARRLAGREPGA